MFRSKHIAVLIAQFFLSAVCFAQPREKIDSLKKVLLTAKGIERINCLNSLSNAYLFSSFGSRYYYIKRDSSLLFSKQAFHESQIINYKQGMADALFNEGKFKEDNREKEQLYLRAISFYRQCGKVDTLGEAYFHLGEALRSEANFLGSIAAYRKAEQLFQEAKDSLTLGVTFTFLGLAYGTNGDFEKAFEYGYKALQVRERNKQYDPFGVIWALSNLGRLFQEVEDYPAAIDYYYTKSRDYAKTIGMSSLGAFFFDKISECFWRMHQYDSALYYMQEFVRSSHPDSADFQKSLDDTSETDFHIGQIHLIKNEYDKALKIFFNEMKAAESKSDRVQIMETLDYISEAYIGKKDDVNALINARKLLALAQNTGARQYMRDGTKSIWQIYDHQKFVDSAYKYHQQYAAMKDSVSNYRFLSQMTAFKQAAANEKKELAYQQELAQQAFIKKLLAAGIIVILFIAVIVFRNISLKRKNAINQKEILQNELHIQKLESEKTKVELQQHATELEMQALRAQMNPHFIFNSLNSINRFILKKQSSEASEYLTKFSKLIRMILKSSVSSSVSLAEDLEALQLYLELERLRCEEKFGFKIKVDPDLDIDFIEVPPMLLQPFVENAIWHGLMNKDGEGHLLINIQQEDSVLLCTIADDGIGRKKAAELRAKSGKHQSMGMKITESRIAMMQKMNGENKSVAIRDLIDAEGNAEGTEVILKIPLAKE